MRVRVEFKVQDCWIGAYWATKDYSWETQVDLWVCLLPMLPIHFTWARDRQ